MAKHVCGSCRFFDEARDGKHGWCTHPDRRETSTVRILVRAGELRCRNDWGQDQWQERVASDQVLGVVMNDADAQLPHRTSRDVPGPAHAPDHYSPIPATFASNPLTPIADQPPVEAVDAEDARSVSADLNRELLRKAHAQARERQQKKGYAVPAPRSSEPDPLVISNQYIPPSRDTGNPVNRGMTDSVFEFGGRKREAEFDAVPELDGDPGFPAASAKRDRAATHRPDRRADSRIESPRWLDDLPDDEMPVASQSPASRDETVPEPWAEADKYERQPEHRVDDSDLPVEDAFDARLDDEADEFATWARAEASERPPEPFRLWAEIPRCCQTCRDFRPAGSGERGWCNNQWAFKHRRMVDANDRPCETSIGHWWIPGDAAWQGEFDVSALGQPTPLMDKWFGRSRGGEEPAEGPGDRRRRKTGSW